MKDNLREALLAIAGLASAILSLLGILIFFWTVDLQHSPSRDLWAGVLFCLGPVLSAPVFLIVFISPRWHLRLMWLVACASFLMTWAAIVIYRSNGRFGVNQAIAAILIACQPLVLAPFLIALVVAISNLLSHSDSTERQ